MPLTEGLFTSGRVLVGISFEAPEKRQELTEITLKWLG